jgi:hypothetical protein
MNSPVPQMENVYALSPEPRHRLLGVRTLELLNSHERYQLSVKDVCEYLRPVAEYKDSVGCLNRLIECELVLADEREHAELDANDPSPKVKLRLTDTGVGVLGVCYTYNYLSCQMYFTPCDTSASKYPAYSAEERAGEATLETTFSTLRVFLRETADIETDDIKRALKYLETHPDDEAARNADGGLLLGLRMPCLYEETVAAAGRIAMAPRSKAAVDSALNFTDEYEAWRNEMRLLEGVTLPEHGKEYRSMLARLAEEASDPAEPAGGGGPVGGGTAKYHRYHRHSDWHGTQK